MNTQLKIYADRVNMFECYFDSKLKEIDLNKKLKISLSC